MEQGRDALASVARRPAITVSNSQNPQAQMHDRLGQRKISYGNCGVVSVPIRFIRPERLMEDRAIVTGLKNVMKTGLGGPTQNSGVLAGAAAIATYTE
jgi:hypothetical protein